MGRENMTITQLELIKSHRREMPPSGKIFRVKKMGHNRRDKSWKKEVQEVIAERSYA